MSAHGLDPLRPRPTDRRGRARAGGLRARIAILSGALLAVAGAGAWIAFAPADAPASHVAEPAPVDPAIPGSAVDEPARLVPPPAFWSTGRGEPTLARAAPDAGEASKSTPAGAGVILRAVNRFGGAPVPDLPLGVRAQSGSVWKGRTDGDGRAVTSIAAAAGSVRMWIDERNTVPPSVPWRLEREDHVFGEREVLQGELEIAVVPAVLELLAEVESIGNVPSEPVGGIASETARPVQVYLALENAPGDEPLEDACTQSCLTDALGNARFFLFDPRSLGARARMWSVASDGLQSEALTLAPPLGAGPWRLVLRKPASVTVAVRQHDGSPAARCFARLEARDGGAQLFAEGRSANALGRVSFERVPGGNYRLAVRDERTQTSNDSEIVVTPGEAREVLVDLPEASAPLAVAGAVVDELGVPLSSVVAWIEVEGRSEVALCTDEEGRFEHRAPAAPRVRVRLADGLLDPLFEPSERVVAFGARELVFRRVRAPTNSILRLEFRDGQSGELIEIVRMRMRIAAPRELDAGGDFSDVRWRVVGAAGALADRLTRNGQHELWFQRGRHLRAMFESPGFRRAEADLDLLLAAQVSLRDGITVVLERGFGCELHVRDAGTRAAIAGALCIAQGLRPAVSDENGVVRLSALAWPASVTIERDGYLTRRWDPDAEGALEEIVWLEPESAAADARK